MPGLCMNLAENSIYISKGYTQMYGSTLSIWFCNLFLATIYIFKIYSAEKYALKPVLKIEFVFSLERHLREHEQTQKTNMTTTNSQHIWHS